MDNLVHSMDSLFKQLGLPADKAAIDGFIARHAPLDDAIRLELAPFWSPQQAQFLSEAVRDDADWAPIFDQLNVLLRKQAD